MPYKRNREHPRKSQNAHGLKGPIIPDLSAGRQQDIVMDLDDILGRAGDLAGTFLSLRSINKPAELDDAIERVNFNLCPLDYLILVKGRLYFCLNFFVL